MMAKQDVSVLLLAMGITVMALLSGADASSGASMAQGGPKGMRIALETLAETSQSTKDDMKAQAVSQASDSGKRDAGHQAMANLDPSQAIMGALGPNTPPDNTTSDDQGSIGPDGKRTGKLSDPPNFMFPAIFAGVTFIVFLGVAAYICCFRKEDESLRKQNSYV
mmetsp:Transcript_15322/g.23857  ORF Transcript_15322/g.23857 Transcript_15322/m.23857 type:complete len:165 (-) Transcript_15322:143-637(-)